VRLEISTVRNKRDLAAYVSFPYTLYRNDPVWIAPLRTEEKKKFDPRRNRYLGRCDFEHFLLKHGSRVVGRVSAFVDPVSTECWGTPVALFGSYETYDRPEYAEALLNRVVQWAAEKKLSLIRGPMHFESQEWGFLYSGFETPPMVMAPYNPPCYNEHVTRFGFRKTKDLLVYDLDSPNEYVLPDRFSELCDAIERKHNITVRPVNMKRLREDVRKIVDVSNASTSDNWGFVPVTPEEADDIADSLKQVVDPDIVMLAEVDGTAVGYLIVLPDINQLLAGLNGRLLPRALWRILFQRKSISRFRVWALGIIPEYQRKAIDTLFYKRLYDVLGKRNMTHIEANYVLEDNMAMNNPIIKMGFSESKRYRVYELPV